MTTIEPSATIHGLAFSIYGTGGDPQFDIAGPDDRDIKIDVKDTIDLDAVRASRGCMLRITALFLDLAALAREDERLHELMSRYQLEVKHGEKTLWPQHEDTGA
mgnify:CR=1 FL=1